MHQDGFTPTFKKTLKKVDLTEQIQDAKKNILLLTFGLTYIAQWSRYVGEVLTK